MTILWSYHRCISAYGAPILETRPLTSRLVSRTARQSRACSVMLLLPNPFDALGHVAIGLVGVLVGVALLNSIDRGPEALPGLLAIVLGRYDHGNRLARVLDDDRFFRLSDPAKNIREVVRRFLRR